MVPGLFALCGCYGAFAKQHQARFVNLAIALNKLEPYSGAHAAAHALQALRVGYADIAVGAVKLQRAAVVAKAVGGGGYFAYYGAVVAFAAYIGGGVVKGVITYQGIVRYLGKAAE